jgi:hypothetical protein
MHCSISSICDNGKIFVTVVPTEGIPTLTQWWGLCGQMILSSAGSGATGMASCARQVKGDDPDKKGYPGPPGWGLCVRQTVSPHKFSERIRLLNEGPQLMHSSLRQRSWITQ